MKHRTYSAASMADQGELVRVFSCIDFLDLAVRRGPSFVSLEFSGLGAAIFFLFIFFGFRFVPLGITKISMRLQASTKSIKRKGFNLGNHAGECPLQSQALGSNPQVISPFCLKHLSLRTHDPKASKP